MKSSLFFFFVFRFFLHFSVCFLLEPHPLFAQKKKTEGPKHTIETQIAMTGSEVLYDGRADFQSIREKRMIDNFRHVTSAIADPEPSFFGLWGAAHIHQRSWNNDTWLAQRLQEEENFGLKDKVVSIKIFYDESHSLLKNPYRIGVQQSERSIVNTLEPFTTKAALFHLADTGSPFTTTSTIIIDGNGGVTTDYFQFAFFFGVPKRPLPTAALFNNRRLPSSFPPSSRADR